MKFGIKPPKLLEWILTRFLQYDEEYEKLGDFRESYIEVVGQKGLVAGAIWYFFQIVKAIPTFIINALYRSSAMFKNYFKIAIRNLFRYKTYSILNIGGLAVGISVFLMIGLYVQFELDYVRHNEKAERIYKVIFKDQAVTPAPFAPALADEFPEVEAATRLCDQSNVLVRYDNRVFVEDSWVWADDQLFNVFSFKLLSGDKNTVFENPGTVIISEETAAKFFGAENPVGKVLQCSFSGSANDMTVTGVFENIPGNSHIKGNIFAKLETLEDFGMSLENWGNYYIDTFFVLNRRGDPKLLEEKYPQWLETKHNFKDGSVFYNLALLDIHLRSSELVFHFSSVNDIRYIYLFSTVGLIILIIVFINYLNLTTAQAVKRTKEVRIRKVAGAMRFQLVKQFLGESIMITSISLVFSLVFAYLLLPMFNSIVVPEEPLVLSKNLNLIFIMIGSGLFLGIIAGSYPAVFISKFALSGKLKGISNLNTRSLKLRNILVVVQFAISIFLIISTFVISDQLHFIRNKDLGFSKENIVVLSIDDTSVYDRSQAFKEELLKNPGVKDVAFSTTIPMKINWHNTFLYQNENDSKIGRIPSHYSRVDYGYIDVFDLEIIRGRNFDKKLDEGKNAYIINEYTAKLAGWDDPIGKEYTRNYEYNNGERGTIVGVVRDFHSENMHIPISPVTLVLAPDIRQIMSIKLGAGEINETINDIEKVWNDFSNGYPFTFEFMDERYDNMYKTEIRMSSTINYFSILAVLICCLGLFGLASYTVEQSTKEIGIRKSLGASVPVIVKMLSWKFLKWTLAANIVSWPIAFYYMNKWLQGFVYRIEIGWGVFVYAAALAFVIAFLTIISRTMQAALADPTDSLRYE